MKSYVWLTFAFMGWGYYELSGGADFVPEVREVAEVAPVAEETPDIVARADTTLTTMAISSSSPEVSADVADAELVDALADATALDDVEVTPVAAPAAEPEVIEEVLDLRNVKGSRVNMRMGPGTNYEVITTLDGGTELEIIAVDDNGWANVRTMDLGIEGWMAERLLTEPKI